jgi:antitoxin component of MazEF toxin-antitoxin module
MTVTVKKIGGSVAVVIPKALAREMKLSEGTTLEISGNDNTIVMRRRAKRARRPLRQIVAEIKPASYKRRRPEFSGDLPVGREVW